MPKMLIDIEDEVGRMRIGGVPTSSLTAAVRVSYAFRDVEISTSKCAVGIAPELGGI